jgi:FKBP-type peptidyl-prolyl cis-trans isomerase SlyD
MTVQDNMVVSFDYTLTDRDGRELDSTRGGEPLSYLQGAGNIIPGLEKAMAGRVEGDRFQVTIPPEEAYGERKEGQVRRIPLKRLGSIARPRPGQVLGLQTRQGPVQVTVVKVGRFHIDVDANHPLAGRELNFDVEITGIRQATDEEMRHRHAHGPGGYRHD